MFMHTRHATSRQQTDLPAVQHGQTVQTVEKVITKMSIAEIQAYLASVSAPISSTAAAAAHASEIAAQSVLPVETALPVQSAVPVAQVASVSSHVLVPHVVPLLSAVPISSDVPASTSAPTATRQRQRISASQQTGRPQTGQEQRQTSASTLGRQPTVVTPAAAKRTQQPARRSRPFSEPIPGTSDSMLTAVLTEIESVPNSSQPIVPIRGRMASSTVIGYTRTRIPSQIVEIGTEHPILPVQTAPVPEVDPEVRNLLAEWQEGQTECMSQKHAEMQVKVAKFLQQGFDMPMSVEQGQITYRQAIQAWSNLSAALAAMEAPVKIDLLVCHRVK